MGQATANAVHRSDDSGKDLSGTPELSSRLDDIANAGNANWFARRNRVESCLVNSPILQHEPHEIFLVRFQYPGLVAIAVAQIDLADGKICHFETHSSLGLVSEVHHNFRLRILLFPTAVRCDRQ